MIHFILKITASHHRTHGWPFCSIKQGVPARPRNPSEHQFPEKLRTVEIGRWGTDRIPAKVVRMGRFVPAFIEISAQDTRDIAGVDTKNIERDTDD